MMEVGFAITLFVSGAASALAYGYRCQRDQEREQVVWLRKELADVRKPPPPTPQGEAQRGTQPRSNVPALVDGGRP